jgi:hypothetical protein
MTSIESIRRFTECGTKAWSKSELGAKSLIGIWSNKVQATKDLHPNSILARARHLDIFSRRPWLGN